jgi:hypoxanthine-DNA glycosylase
MKKAFAPFIDDNSKILILGTMPGEKSLELQEYYGNKGNQFWKLLYALLDLPLTHNYEEKVRFLKDYGIAVWDVLESCEREGSLDSKIKKEKANDFKTFYLKHPHIKHVFFSSKNAAAYYDKYIGKSIGINYETLPSPSGANASMSFKDKLEIWREKILPLIIK